MYQKDIQKQFLRIMDGTEATTVELDNYLEVIDTAMNVPG